MGGPYTVWAGRSLEGPGPQAVFGEEAHLHQSQNFRGVGEPVGGQRAYWIDLRHRCRGA